MARGTVHVKSGEHLVALLARMANQQLPRQARHDKAARRDIRRLADERPEDLEVTTNQGDPVCAAIDKEHDALLVAQLGGLDGQLLTLRRSGKSWDDIAAATGMKPDAIRLRLRRFQMRIWRKFDADAHPTDATTRSSVARPP